TASKTRAASRSRSSRCSRARTWAKTISCDSRTATDAREPRAERGLLEGLSHARADAWDVQGSASVGGPYRTLAAFSRTRAAFKSCCNKAISNGLSIRGVFEVASFRPGKAVEAKPEPFSPPIFEVSPMLSTLQSAHRRDKS